MIDFNLFSDARMLLLALPHAMHVIRPETFTDLRTYMAYVHAALGYKMLTHVKARSHAGVSVRHDLIGDRCVM